MKRPHPLPCPEWASQLAALHPDDLSQATHAALRAHLAACPACAATRAHYLAMAAHIRQLPSVQPLAAMPPRIVAAWAEAQRQAPGDVPISAPALVPSPAVRPGLPEPLQERRLHAAVSQATDGCAPADAEEPGEPDLLGVAEATPPEIPCGSVEFSHLAESEVTGLAGLPERLPHALAVIPPSLRASKPARFASQWQALVACVMIVPLLLLIMPLGALQQVGQRAAGHTLDAYIHQTSFAQHCIGPLALSAFTLTLDNTQDTQPLDWYLSIQETDPSGTLLWARASATSGTVPAGEQMDITLTPLSILCELMQGAPAPIDYHATLLLQGQRVTITEQVTPP